MSSEGLKSVFRLLLKTTYRSSEFRKRCRNACKVGAPLWIPTIVHNYSPASAPEWVTLHFATVANAAVLFSQPRARVGCTAS